MDRYRQIPWVQISAFSKFGSWADQATRTLIDGTCFSWWISTHWQHVATCAANEPLWTIRRWNWKNWSASVWHCAHEQSWDSERNPMKHSGAVWSDRCEMLWDQNIQNFCETPTALHNKNRLPSQPSRPHVSALLLLLVLCRFYSCSHHWIHHWIHLHSHLRPDTGWIQQQQTDDCMAVSLAAGFTCKTVLWCCVSTCRRKKT